MLQISIYFRFDRGDPYKIFTQLLSVAYFYREDLFLFDVFEGFKVNTYKSQRKEPSLSVTSTAIVRAISTIIAVNLLL